MAMKITESAQNYRVSRVSGNTPVVFFRPYARKKKNAKFHWHYISVWSIIVNSPNIGNKTKYTNNAN